MGRGGKKNWTACTGGNHCIFLYTFYGVFIRTQKRGVKMDVKNLKLKSQKY